MDVLTRFRLWQDSAVGVISETTRDDLRTYYPRQAAGSTLLYMPNGLPGKLAAMPQARAADVAAKLQATPLELLFVGRVNRLKGFDRVRRVCQSLDRRLGEAEVRRRAILRVVGKTTNESRDLLTGMNFEWITVVSYDYVSDDELNRLYRNAAFCFFLSRNEGFGLPVIESLWSGCVPVLSDAAVFREIMGPDYPLFGDNTDDSVADHIMEVVTSPDRWRQVLDHHQQVLAQWSDGYRRAARAVLRLLPTGLCADSMQIE
jgi:glycosyltransferase involved in cell wall biosynthesis